jgi:hypothetical protein
MYRTTLKKVSHLGDQMLRLGLSRLRFKTARCNS